MIPSRYTNEIGGRLVIIGAGNFGREVLSWAVDNNWNVAGGFFLDNRPDILQKYGSTAYSTLLGSVEEYIPESRDVFVCAIGNPKIKKQIIEIMLKKGARFIRLIHPTATIGLNSKIGQGVIICPQVVISSDSTIEDYATINIHCSIGHDVKIGKYSQLASQVNLTGHVSIGQEVLINSNACIVPEVTVGDGATIGAGSIVLRDVEPNQTVFGNPARVIHK